MQENRAFYLNQMYKSCFQKDAFTEMYTDSWFHAI